MAWFARNQRPVLVIDGLLGAAIGAVSTGYQSAVSPITRDRLGTFLFSSGLTAMLLAIPMFLATVALVPALLAVVRRWSHQPASHYYLKSALAGVVFGFVVCAAVGFVTGVLLPLLPQPGGIALNERVLLLLGAPFYLAMGFFFTGFFFWQQIVIAGVPFGLFNGWWLRRHAAESG